MNAQGTKRAALLAAAVVAIGITGAGRAGDDGPWPLPDLHFQDAEGKPLTLEDFRGRVVLLNIWATWCVPCRKEMPALDRLQAQLGGPGFEVVAVSIDRDPVAVRKFFRQYGIRHLALYIDPSSDIAGALGIVGIPATVLVNRDGSQRWRRLGPAEWDAPEAVASIRRAIESGQAAP